MINPMLPYKGHPALAERHQDEILHVGLVLQWVGWIKDYDGGTLMECVINPKLPYTDFPTLVERQREALDRHIRTLSRSHVVHPGLTSFAADGNHHLSVSSIPGVWQAAAAACWAHHACAQGCIAARETC